ncbi:hypothetical protein WR25_19212 [Diploscapter pachys]|uniref:Protein kinase domain-containing protein n=1 Tax=Diploscapter pachys TaxID=2018661 RepID=A0A2A2KRP8_9BILA|nr:hypothetical protein WR25_19212 [Diploscapter pachys]
MLKDQNPDRCYPKVYGTPLYMAPEQENGELCTKAVDIWAIGIIFYELAIAPVRFSSQARYDIIEKKRNRLPGRFSERDDDWLDKMTVVEPCRRMAANHIKEIAMCRVVAININEIVRPIRIMKGPIFGIIGNGLSFLAKEVGNRLTEAAERRAEGERDE